jgi:hypothetical protein
MDYDDASRPQSRGYDIGAHEYGFSSSQSTPTSSTPKPVPTSTTEEHEIASLPLET